MPPPEPVDYERLEEFLRALSHSRRLELLHLLQVPHALAEIRLAPGRQRAGDSPTRPLAKQSVQEHLDKLVEIGVVSAHDAPEGKRGKEYAVNPQRLYLVSEEFRKVSSVKAHGAPSRDVTVATPGDAAVPAMEPGPKLVLVHGFLEGKAFMLRRKDIGEGRGWAVGRKAGLPVSLEYDPYVSLVNSEVLPKGDQFLLADLGSSKNGTRLNWRPVGAEPMPLTQGDVVGVGRSLLVFRRD